jgi:hypothetical protein
MRSSGLNPGSKKPRCSGEEIRTVILFWILWSVYALLSAFLVITLLTDWPEFLHASSRLLKNSLRVQGARNLECGDLSPLLLRCTKRPQMPRILASKPYESGDKSPHSKKDGSLELVFQQPLEPLYR